MSLFPVELMHDITLKRFAFERMPFMGRCDVCDHVGWPLELVKDRVVDHASANPVFRLVAPERLYFAPYRSWVRRKQPKAFPPLSWPS